MISTDYIYGRKTIGAAIQPNTFIGGVASTIQTAAALATKLSILESDISYFNINGNDIEVRIEANYIIPIESFYQNLNITEYRETEAKVTLIDVRAFMGCSLLKFAKFLGGITIKDAVFRNTKASTECPNALISGNAWYDCTGEIIYLPKVENKISSSTGNDNAFYLFKGYLYVHPSLETSNNGGEEGDVALARNQGAKIRYVSNFNNPSDINDLSVKNIYAFGVELQFTTPSSGNSIDYYEVYVDEKLNRKVLSGSTVYASGLEKNTSYNISIVVVDIFYNKSTISNTITVVTNSEANLIQNALHSYFKLDGTLINSLDTGDGTNYGTTSGIQGKIGTGYYNDGSGYFVLPANFNAINDFTVRTWVNYDGSLTNGALFSLNKGSNWQLLLYGDTSFGTAINQMRLIDVTNSQILLGPDIKNQLVHIALVKKSTKYTLYVNSIKISEGTHTNNLSGVDNIRFFDAAANLSRKMKGMQDEIAIWTKALSGVEVQEDYNENNGVTF